tara:strand:- start:4213 stop:4974 length:762 start_codon:yes stop_codon:yes gene_type:complete
MNKIKKINSLKKKFTVGKYSIGTWQQLNDSNVSEILANSGYDWVTLDLEHGAITLDKLQDHIRAIELYDVLPFVRIKSSSIEHIQTAIEAGAAGIILPQVNSSNQLKQLIKAAKIPPRGSRGIGYSRANLYGMKFNEYLKEKNIPLLIAIIENNNSLEDIEEICRIKELDGLFIGPYDLSASLGITGKFDNKKYISIVKYIIKCAKKNNKPCGIHVVSPDEKELKMRIKQGFQLLAYSLDTVFLNKNCLKPKI